MVMFQILLDGAEPCDAGTTQLSSPVCRRGGQQDPLGICVVVHAHNVSSLPSMRIIIRDSVECMRSK